VPDVVGLTTSAASTAITAVDSLVVGTTTNQYSNTVAAGLVISQSPVGGSAVDIGSAVNIVVSLGKPVVPNVVGLTTSAASTAITAVDSLVVGTTINQFSNTVESGKVISQSPVGSTAVDIGSAVNIVVSLGKPVVPNVVGETTAAATTAITAVDSLVVGTTTSEFSNTVESGKVISQSPVGSTAVDIGSAVDIVVSLGPQARIISGRIVELDGNTPVAGVVVDANNNGGSIAVTDTNGGYTLSVPYGWSGTATPTKEGYSFEPNSVLYNNVSDDDADENYTATLTTFVISGHVLGYDGITPISDVNVTAENGGGQWTSRYGGGSGLTDANGYYRVVVDYNWTGKVTPAKAVHAFEPNSRSYVNVKADQTDQNYAGRLLNFAISGYVRNECSVPVKGVSVSANNGGNTVVTDANGFYEVWVSYNWSGNVIPSKSYYTFTPLGMAYTNVVCDEAGQNYVGVNIYDFDCNGYIGFGDVAVLSDNWLNTTPGNVCDLNGDHVVNFKDLARFAKVWLTELNR
jgi:beta-lactam-binding protein with PASTA domain